MDRKDLIRLYLNAETSCEQEQELAASFTATPPADEEEEAVYRMMLAVKPIRQAALPEAGDEYDRMVRQARRRTVRNWSLAFSGIAALLLAVVFLGGRPTAEPAGTTDSIELLQQLQWITSLDPADADSYDFKPVGDGFIMTAHFPDGRSASYLLTMMEGQPSFNLVSLND